MNHRPVSYTHLDVYKRQVAINASIAGVIAGVKSSETYDICYGAVNGILGILNENYLNPVAYTHLLGE